MLSAGSGRPKTANEGKMKAIQTEQARQYLRGVMAEIEELSIAAGIPVADVFYFGIGGKYSLYLETITGATYVTEYRLGDDTAALDWRMTSGAWAEWQTRPKTADLPTLEAAWFAGWGKLLWDGDKPPF